jgi:leucyl aminopeptidase
MAASTRKEPSDRGDDMEIRTSHGDIRESTADTIVVNLFEGVSRPGGATGAVDGGLGGAISELIASGDIRGKLGEITVLYPRGAITAKRVLVVGLGPASTFDLETVRRAAGSAAKRARDLNARHLATIVHGGGIGGLAIGDAAQATVEGSILASYRYEGKPAEAGEARRLETLTLVEFDSGKMPAIEDAVGVARAVCAGTTLARDLVNMPPNVATPTAMADVAEAIAREHGMTVTVGDRAWAAARDMGAFLAVAKGAGDEPRFIVLEHQGGDPDARPVVLVGKGITFDTGGISIKPSADMGKMKSDMGGAAAVLGAMKAIGQLNLPLRVIGIAPCTENKPDAHAYRPADVITASNGKTIEIISTDAEGRMVLADALVYAGRYQPRAVIDLATLTGSCVVALGQGQAAGLLANDDALRDALLTAAETTHERLWPLPLWEDYRDAIKSDVADVKNSGGRFGGIATSAVFLQTFTDYPWAHLDIAGMALDEQGNKAYQPKGATGFGVRLLSQYLLDLLG